MSIKANAHIINSETRDKISSRYKKVTKAVNMEFWNSSSETLHSLYVGSYGRNTAISTSDIDILVWLPEEEFDRFNNLKGNSQSRFLQAVKSTIEEAYPRSDVRADGQIIKINFSDDIMFEILPSFRKDDGSFVYADTNDGGRWKPTEPKKEQEAIQDKNSDSNGLLVATCKHIRYVKQENYKSYKLSGIVIDSFVYHAIGNWFFSDSPSFGYITYEEYLLEQFKNKEFYWDLFGLDAPGSREKVNFESSKECLKKVLEYMVKE